MRPSCLPHPNGVNVSNPRPTYDVQLAFENGAWTVWETNVSPAGQRLRTRPQPIARNVAAAVAEALGYVHPDVIEKTYLMWTEAALLNQRETSRRLRQKAEVELLEAQDAVKQAAKATAALG